MREAPSNDKMGITFLGRHLGWGVWHGHLRSWPYPVKKLNVRCWNKAMCFLTGHETFGPIHEDGVDIKKHCIHCSREWP